MNIVRGVQKTGVKMTLYGPEGVGKSTFAAHMDGAVFIDTEGGTKFMDVARVDGITGWADIIAAVDYFLAHPGELKTLVIDTIDWAERFASDQVCAEKKWGSLEDAGYGKGYVYLKAKIQELLGKLSQLTEKGVNVVLLAHSIVRKFEQPDEMGAYDRYTLKLNDKNVAPLVKEWSDMLLFVNFRTDVVKAADGKTMKGRGGQKRVMYANHTAAFDAKNRFGLPDEMPFEFEQIAPILRDGDAPGADPAPAAAPAEEAGERVQALEKAAEVVKAMVETAKTVPAKKSAKKEAQAEERPDSMKSDDPEKDALLVTLWGLMQRDKIPDPLILQSVVSEKDYYDIVTPVRDYEKEFISDVLIEAWNQVNSLCQTKIHNLPF